MDRHPPRSQIIDTEHAADDIPPHVIKDQHLPDRVSVLVQDRGRVGDETLSGIMGAVLRGARVVIQVEDLLNGC